MEVLTAQRRTTGSLLPVYYFINNLILLCAGTAQVNPGSFQIFVPQQIREQRQIAAFFNEALGKPVAEGVRMNDIRVQPI